MFISFFIFVIIMYEHIFITIIILIYFNALKLF